jgi:hypothetical protein
MEGVIYLPKKIKSKKKVQVSMKGLESIHNDKIKI